MGFFDFWLKRNISAVDAGAIRRAVRDGILNAQAAQVRREADQCDRQMRDSKEHRAEIQEARAYDRAFRRVSAETSKAFGWLDWSPLDEPQRMTRAQVLKTYEVLEGLTARGVVPSGHADRIRQYLKGARPDIQN